MSAELENIVFKGVKFIAVLCPTNSCSVETKDEWVDCVFSSNKKTCPDTCYRLIYILDPDPVNLVTYRLTQ